MAPTTTCRRGRCRRPTRRAAPGQLGFRFDRSGYRVPAIIVSPWVDAGRVFTDEYRHTSMIATLREVWGLGEPFTDRDAAARTFDGLLSLESPREPDTWPDVTPLPVPDYQVDRVAVGQASAPSVDISATASSSTCGRPEGRRPPHQTTPTTCRRRWPSTSCIGWPPTSSRTSPPPHRRKPERTTGPTYTGRRRLRRGGARSGVEMAKVKLGTNLPEHLIGQDQGALAEFLAAIEELGYAYITVGDHVLGAELGVRPEWRPYRGKPPIYDQRTPWHEPMVLFGYLSALSTTIEFATGILVSPQRQTALLAKQAAEVDVLSGGRLRLVVATGWNDVEYEALGVDFHQRGRIIEEQVELMRELWTEEVVTYRGRFHTVNAAGINPLPVQRPIPLWFGGTAPKVLERVGRMGDGWFPHYPFFIEDQIHADLAVIAASARAAGRGTSAPSASRP